jgi:GxxExxY protein
MTPVTDQDPASNKVIGLAIEVHRHLGPGRLESAYEDCLALEMRQAGIIFQRQAPLPVTYKGMMLDCTYRLDFVVESYLIAEIKAVERLLPVHESAAPDISEAQRDEGRTVVELQCAFAA